MKNILQGNVLSCLIPASLCVLATQASAVTFNNAGGDNYWGNDANWSDVHPNGADTSASFQKSGIAANQDLFLANSSGVDQSFTVGTLTIGSGGGGGASTHSYEVKNVSGGTASLIFQTSSGSATLNYQNLYANPTMEINTGVILNSNLNIDVKDTSGTFQINGDVSGANGISLVGVGTFRFNGVGSYTGDTTLGSGTLLLGAADRIADTSDFVFDGGTLATGGFSDAMGTLLLSDTSSIDLGSGASALSFLDSSALSWAAATTLNIANFDEGVDSVRFGTDALGLTSTQLSQITLNGGSAYIDGSGYLTAVPEAGSFALLGGLLALSSIAMRRRK